MSLDIIEFDSQDLIKELEQMFKGIAKEKDLEFIIEDHLNKKMIGDKDKISQILRNLLSNAFKFTEQGPIVFKIVPDEEYQNAVNISVIDTGIGIPKEKQKIIFEAFQQVNGSISRKFGGTGLGLSICKKVISEEGIGSEFTLFLPNAIAGVTDKNQNELEFLEDFRNMSLEEASVSKDLEFISESDKMILVIEDDKEFADAIKQINKSMGYDTLAALNGEEGLELAGKYKVDGILLDLGLPDMSGIEVLRELKGMRELRETPVIVYTGMDLTEKQENELRKYAESIIIKTANSDERLLEEVTQFFHNVRKNENDGHYLLPRTKEEYALSLKDKKILIVDDDARNIFVLAAVLENYNATIYEAENGKAALELLKAEKIDLILMDIMMPVMDGYEAIKEIRKDDILKHIPIIALTAKALKGDRGKCIEAGADDYISKPVDYDALIRLVKAWISK